MHTLHPSNAVRGVAAQRAPQLVAPIINRRPSSATCRASVQEPFQASSPPAHLSGTPHTSSSTPSHSRKSTIAGVAAQEASTSASTNGAGAGTVENVVIIGSGPAGYTAAIYAARANLKPLVFEGLQNGKGGQLMGTTEVENFPGFPEGVTGPELMERMRLQAERWGAEMVTDDVEVVDLSVRPFRIKSSDMEVRADSIIIATGATARRLHLPSETQFWSKGISACAICDGASPLFKNREVAVVGGGDSATEEAVYLTKYCSRVHLLVRSDKLRASKTMADRALAHPKVKVHFDTTVDDAYGKDVLAGLKLRNLKTGETKDLPVAGLFYGIGHQPNSKLIKGQVELDDVGYVKVSHGVSTSVPGVFSAGDLHDPEWRQAITAAGSGCMAALSAERYLTANNLVREVKSVAVSVSSYDEATSNGSSSSSSNGRSSSSSSQSGYVSDEATDSFDLTKDAHKGQYALRKLYHESDRLIAVLYTSPSCGPCKTLKPIFKGVMGEYAGKVHYVEIDIERDQEIAEAAGVTGTPTVQFFKSKARLQVMSGVKMKKDYRAVIEGVLAEQKAKVPA